MFLPHLRVNERLCSRESKGDQDGIAGIAVLVPVQKLSETLYLVKPTDSVLSVIRSSHCEQHRLLRLGFWFVQAGWFQNREAPTAVIVPPFLALFLSEEVVSGSGYMPALLETNCPCYLMPWMGHLPGPWQSCQACCPETLSQLLGVCVSEDMPATACTGQKSRAYKNFCFRYKPALVTDLGRHPRPNPPPQGK